MLPSKAKWEIGQADPAVVTEIAAALDLDPMVAGLLAVRGIRTAEEAHRFLSAGPDHFHDPFLLGGMKEAVERIRSALDRGEKIRVYGDYDADGVSSTSLMIHLFRSLGANFDFYIPHRVTEGYGLNKAALEAAAAHGVRLLVTVDTGISAKEQVAYAAELGIDVIVTDHHEPPPELPEAVAVVNPKKPGCPYPFKQLAGAGVALKLAHALLGRVPEELLEIASIGTVGDLMPLLDENRVIVKLGLERMRSTAYPGIRALLEVSGIERGKVNATHIGFALAPRINASGRLEAADDAVKLLVTEDPQEAVSLAEALDRLNKERQRIVDEIAKEAVAMAEHSVEGRPRGVIVVAREGWNVGVIGIVASKLLEKFYRPTIVLSIDPETGMTKGSARSIPGFDMYRALTECAGLLDHFGGHQAAAGMSLARERIDAFRSRLQELAGDWLTEEHFKPVLKADLSVQLEQDPSPWVETLDRLAPFGVGNPSPRFIFRGLRIVDKKTMGRDSQHLKLIVSAQGEKSAQPGANLDAVGFGRSHLAGAISQTARVDVLGELGINEWNGVRKAQIVIHDLCVPSRQVFDWRGIRDSDERWRSLLAQEENGAVGFVLFDEKDIAEVAGAASKDAGWWAPEGTAGMKRLRGGSESFADVRDLILYSLPPDLEVLRRVLAYAHRAERVYAVFRDLRGRQQPLPTRGMFKQVYTVLRQADGPEPVGYRGLDPIVYLSKRSGLSPDMVKFIIEVFEELSLVEKTGGDYRRVPSPPKQELTLSRRYRQRLAQRETEQELIYSSAAELTEQILNILKENDLSTEVNP